MHIIRLVLISTMTLWLASCAMSPLNGNHYSGQIPLQAVVPTIAPVSTVHWAAARVNSEGTIYGWEELNFLTSANATPFTDALGADYLWFQSSGYTYNWTTANTGRVGGCGNLPNSCPQHAIIKTYAVMSDGQEMPLKVFDNDSGSCILSFYSQGGRAIYDNCSMDRTDGTVVIFP
jgi:hypothetical protein